MPLENPVHMVLKKYTIEEELSPTFLFFKAGVPTNPVCFLFLGKGIVKSPFSTSLAPDYNAAEHVKKNADYALSFCHVTSQVT